MFVACLTSQQHASVSQGRICSDNLTCCHTEIQVADQTFYLTQSQYTDTGPTSPSADRRKRMKKRRFVCCLLACLTSQQQARISQGRICSDNLTCCHTEIQVADQTFYLTQSQCTDTGPTSPSADRRKRMKKRRFVCCLLACLTSQQQARISQGRICSDNLTCCHTEIQVADQTFYLTQSQCTDTGPTSPSADRRKRMKKRRFVGCLLACLTSQQQASVSQGRICSDNLTCCHTDIEVADQTFYLTKSQYTDTGLTSPSADPITPGAWQG